MVVVVTMLARAAWTSAWMLARPTTRCSRSAWPAAARGAPLPQVEEELPRGGEAREGQVGGEVVVVVGGRAREEERAEVGEVDGVARPRATRGVEENKADCWTLLQTIIYFVS